MLGRMLRTRSATTAALVLVLVVLIVGAILLYLRLVEQRRHEMLRQAAGQIQLAVERYAVEHDGNYPHRIADLLEAEYLSDWPESPYGGGRLKPLGVTDPWEPGGFVYVGYGPIVALSKDFDPKDKPHMPTEVDNYVLVFYGPGNTGQSRPPGGSHSDGDASAQLLVPPVPWEHVEWMLTAGEDSGLQD